jgi:hypothetical protein
MTIALSLSLIAKRHNCLKGPLERSLATKALDCGLSAPGGNGSLLHLHGGHVAVSVVQQVAKSK